MPIPDDEQFELYLKQFRPASPQRLLIEPEPRRRRNLLLAASAAIAATIIVSFSIHLNRLHFASHLDRQTKPEQLIPIQPLTIRRANVLLGSAPTFEAAIEQVAFSHDAAHLPKDKVSALTSLSKETIQP